MVRLNKTQLSNDQLTLLFTQLNSTLGKLNIQQTDLVLSELLGAEEKIMLAKRLAIIILLLEGMSLYQISESLKVSPATGQKVKREMEKGGFDNLIATLGNNKKDYLKILETLDTILHLGSILPHYNGLDRYRGL